MSRATAVAALVLLSLTACGGDSETPLELIATAGADTIEGETARLSLRQDIEGVPGVDDISLSGEGAVDFDTARATLDLDLAPLLENLGVSAEEGRLETISDGTVAYLRAPFLTEQLDVDTPWVSVDVAELGEDTAGIDLQQLQQLTGSNPSDALGLFEGVVGDSIEEVGEEQVRGADTTRYRATLDLQKAIREAGAVTDEETFQRFVETLGTDELDVDLWVDDEGRIRKYSYVQALPPEAGGGESSITFEYYDFGADVEVRIPSPEETTDLLEVIGSGGSG